MKICVRLSLMCLCALVLGSCHSKKSKNFLVTENLKGKVKTMTETFYPIEEKDGKFEQGKMWFKACYKVDEAGKKTEWVELNADSTVRWKAISKYGAGNREEECDGYKPDGSLDWKSVYKYDENGNKIEEEETNAGGVKNYKIVFVYNQQGVRTERYFYTADGALYSKSAYVFDNAGNLQEEDVYDKDGTLKTKTVSKYDNLDKAGNWLRQVQYANDNPAMVSEREISYY